MKKRYEFSLQYPKPLCDDELADLLKIGRSGLYSRYTSHYVEELEQELAEYYNVQHAITCTSGTAALQGCLVALDFPPGSEVIVTSVADVGVVIPIIYENLIPVFADVDQQTYNISAESVERNITPKTKAVIAVHLAGNPADIDSLRKICKKNNLALLEDLSQAHGAKWNDKRVGSWGDMAYGSFQQSKQITCGEGGVILTNDAHLARRAFIGVDKAWQRKLSLERRSYEFLAPNVRFNAIQAAILKPQIKKLDALINRKKKIASVLYGLLEPCFEVVKAQKILSKASHSYYSFPLYVSDQAHRDRLLEILDKKYNMYCAYGYANPKTLYMCVNALIDPKKYGKGLSYSSRQYPVGTCPNAEELLTRSFLIPFNENFSEEEVRDIGERLTLAIQEVF